MKGSGRKEQAKKRARGRKPVRIALVASMGVALLLAFIATASGAGVSMRVSVDTSGIQANYGSYISSVSSDGRYVAFDSDATNLVTGDTNGLRDVFVKDTSNGQITRISTGSVGAQQYGERPSISANGQYVAFQSAASGLVSGDTNNAVDVFVKNRDTGITTRVSPNGGNMPSISADGRYVAFQASSRVYITDRQTGATSQVSTSYGWSPSVSGDGRYVAYSWDDVYIKDRQTGVTSKVHPVDWCYDSEEGCTAHSPDISADGRYVAYRVNSSNTDYIDVKDLVGGGITPIAGASESSGQQFTAPSVSDDGRYVAYYTDAGRTPFVYDAYVKDIVAGTTTKLSTDTAGGTGNGSSSMAVISGDGTRAAFASDASNLISGDTNGASDIFMATVYEPAPPADITAPIVSSIQPGGTIGSSSATVSAYFSDADPSSGIDTSTAGLTVSGGTVSGCAVTAAGISCAVTGLADGVHAINVSVADNSGNTGSGTGSFTVSTCQAARPALGISATSAFWANYADYEARLLSVNYRLSNTGPGTAYGVQILGTVNTMGVGTVTEMPSLIGDVAVSGSVATVLKYNVPAGVDTFKSSIYASAADVCGATYEYPGPMPGA